MLEFVVKITRDATAIGRGDLDVLRSARFDDTAILQITLIASWFNYIDRVADALARISHTLSSRGRRVWLGCEAREVRATKA